MMIRIENHGSLIALLTKLREINTSVTSTGTTAVQYSIFTHIQQVGYNSTWYQGVPVPGTVQYVFIDRAMKKNTNHT
jgi:hypothetical protein